MKAIGFGIIGFGEVTEKKSGPAFQKIEGSRLSAVTRCDPGKFRNCALPHNVEKYSIS